MEKKKELTDEELCNISAGGIYHPLNCMKYTTPKECAANERCEWKDLMGLVGLCGNR